MRHASNALLLVLSLGLILGACSCDKPEPWHLSPPDKPEKPAPPPPPPPPTATLSVVPAGPTDEYWKGVRVGVAKAGPEMPQIGIAWRTPASADKAAQVQLVEQLTREKAKAILLGPVDAEALSAPAKAAREAGAAVIVIGAAPSDPEAYDCAVAADPAALGAAAAKAMIQAIGGQTGKVVVLRFQPDDAATEECEKAFVAGLGPYKSIVVTQSERFAGTTPDWAASATRTVLQKLGEDSVDGIFCASDAGTQGVVQLLKSQTYAGKLVGCAYSAPLRDAMEGGFLDAMIFTNPIKAGYDGAKAAAARLQGQAVPKKIAGEILVVTPENVRSADMRRVLNVR